MTGRVRIAFSIAPVAITWSKTRTSIPSVSVAPIRSITSPVPDPAVVFVAGAGTPQALEVKLGARIRAVAADHLVTSPRAWSPNVGTGPAGQLLVATVSPVVQYLDLESIVNPPRAADGTVEVPAWRHALINYPHPLLKKGLVVKDRLAVHDGDAKSTYQGFEGNFFVSASNKVRPTAIDRDKSPLTAQDGKLYAGCYVNASVEVWAQDNTYGKGVNVSLRGVQFAADGEAFSAGGAADADEFEDASQEDELV